VLFGVFGNTPLFRTRCIIPGPRDRGVVLGPDDGNHACCIISRLWIVASARAALRLCCIIVSFSAISNRCLCRLAIDYGVFLQGGLCELAL
jgi:hypothetical protein